MSYYILLFFLVRVQSVAKVHSDVFRQKEKRDI